MFPTPQKPGQKGTPKGTPGQDKKQPATHSGIMPLRESRNVEDSYYIGPDYKERLVQEKTDNLFYQYMDNHTSVARPGFNASGKEVQLVTNTYAVTSFPTRVVHQYDVTIVKSSNENTAVTPTARKLVWASKARAERWRSIIYDGNKLAWSSIDYGDQPGIVVQIGDYGKKEFLKENTNGYRLIVRKSKTINLKVLEQWLNKKCGFDESVLEALNFLDHLLRETPSRTFTPIKRAFYNENEVGSNLHNNLNVLKGYYQALRPVINGRLLVNVDSVLCVFWRKATLVSHADSFLNKLDWDKTAKALKPVHNQYGTAQSEAHRFIWDRMKHLEVKPVFPGCTVTRTFKIHFIHYTDCNQATFDYKDPATGVEEKISVTEYFKRKYNYELHSPTLPVVEMTKKGTLYPMECLEIAGLQRYNHKLDDRQTADMLRVAVRRPDIRFGDIHNAKAKLAHSQDPVLKHFGMGIGEQPVKTKARLLPPPTIQFGNQKVEPGTQGRWDLRGKKFLQTNRAPLVCWGVGVFRQGGRYGLSKTQAEQWAIQFKNQYIGHGGKIVKDPVVMEVTGDTAEAVHRLYTATGNHFNQRPQLLIFMVPNRDSWPYTRIKKSCDCRFGVPSQVVQSAQIAKMNPQYMSNVAMKINAKLGGVTCLAVSKNKEAAVRSRSIFIGADVSHASPGSIAPSLSAISVSADKFGAKYMGKCETGHRRVEIIDPQNMKEMLVPLVDQWTRTVGEGQRPENVYYFRDGVSTGQFAQVLEKEVPVIKDVVFHGSGTKNPPKITVVIANKRHHLRAVPQKGDKVAADKNGNPLPGTLIERDVTSPHGWDFLLVSHVALQGTSQPVHYHVIRDEIGHTPVQLQNMIYNHCYQYVRSTTSVSLFPAIYYAHLISNRARPHEDVPGKELPKTGPYFKPSTSSKSKKGKELDCSDDVPPRLLPMKQNETRNHLEMWFV